MNLDAVNPFRGPQVSPEAVAATNKKLVARQAAREEFHAAVAKLEAALNVKLVEIEVEYDKTMKALGETP